jgi:glycosyltransferase involved in cell wall biosynthesis
VRVLTVGNLYPPAGQGGYERIWADAVRALRARGHEVRVLTSDAPAPPDDVLRVLPWHSRDGRWVRGRGVQRRALRAFAPHAAWAEVICWWGMGGLPLALLTASDRPAVGVVADGWMVYGPRVDPRPAPDFGPAAHWIFISRAVEERALAEGLELPRRSVAHPGVDLAPAPEREWAWELAYVGRVAPEKGVDVALAALDALPEATLVVDGPGAEALPAHPRVLARRSPPDAVRDVYAAADAVLFPVVWPEPWGLVPLEAMAVGRPVVATGTGGSGEYLVDGVNALLVAPGDAEALAAAVRRLAAEPALRARLRAGGFETAGRLTASAFSAAVVAEVERARLAGACPRGTPRSSS